MNSKCFSFLSLFSCTTSDIKERSKIELNEEKNSYHFDCTILSSLINFIIFHFLFHFFSGIIECIFPLFLWATFSLIFFIFSTTVYVLLGIGYYRNKNNNSEIFSHLTYFIIIIINQRKRNNGHKMVLHQLRKYVCAFQIWTKSIWRKHGMRVWIWFKENAFLTCKLMREKML